MSKEYPVATFAQMAAIPLEARGRFLAEFPSMLEAATGILMLQKVVGDAGKVSLGEPTWIDDGATNATVTMDMQDCDGVSFGKSVTTFDHSFRASGMSAGTAETQSGSGRKPASPTAEGGDAQPPSPKE